MQNNLFIIAKSGWKYIGYALAAFIIFFILDIEFLAFLALVTIAFLLYLFRNPEREMPFLQKNALLSPVDGVITAIEEVQNSEYRYKIEIESSYCNVGVLRLPMNAKVTSFKMVHGSRMSQKSKLFSSLNEYAEILFVDSEENSVKINHRLKQSFAPIDIYLQMNQELVQGARYGSMINGVTSLYIESNFRLNVTVGQELSASKTLIGYFS